MFHDDNNTIKLCDVYVMYSDEKVVFLLLFSSKSDVNL